MRSDTGSAASSSSLRNMRAGGSLAGGAGLGMSSFRIGGSAIVRRQRPACRAALRLPCVTAAHPSLPLSRLLDLTADAVLAVKSGKSLNDVLARCPADARPAVQSLSFHVMRWLGSAGEVRA